MAYRDEKLPSSPEHGSVEAPPGPAPAPAAPHSNFRRAVWGTIGLAVISGTLFMLKTRSAEGQNKGGGKGKDGADRAIPVAAAEAGTHDVPIYLEGLGTVTPTNTITVKAQVDGRLEKVFFKEGQDVKKGDVLAELDLRPFTIALDQAQAAIGKDAAQLDQAKKTLDRDNSLLSNGIIAQQQVDDQRALVNQFAASVAVDSAAAETARLNLDYAHVKSPIDGVVGVRQIDPGNLVHASDANGIVVLTTIDPIAVVFTLPQDDLGDVARSLSGGKVDVDAFSRDGRDKLSTGDLTVIDNQINVSTGTIRLKATFENKSRVLWPNQFVKARLKLRTVKDAMTIPAAAVLHGPNGTLVYVILGEDTVVSRPVEVDRIQGDTAILKWGVVAGEKVVTDGQSLLKSGSKISIRPPSDKDKAARSDGDSDSVSQGASATPASSAAPSGTASASSGSPAASSGSPAAPSASSGKPTQ